MRPCSAVGRCSTIYCCTMWSGGKLEIKGTPAREYLLVTTVPAKKTMQYSSVSLVCGSFRTTYRSQLEDPRLINSWNLLQFSLNFEWQFMKEDSNFFSSLFFQPLICRAKVDWLWMLGFHLHWPSASGPGHLGSSPACSQSIKHQLNLGKGAKKKGEKKLANVSFAFTHTYTPKKLTFFLFFPKRRWKILKNVQKRKNLNKNILSHVTCGC